MWTLEWPKEGLVDNLMKEVVKYVLGELDESDVHLIFDRYHEYSTKSSARLSCKGKVGYVRMDSISETTPLPPREAVLKCTSNK